MNILFDILFGLVIILVFLCFIGLIGLGFVLKNYDKWYKEEYEKKSAK